MTGRVQWWAGSRVWAWYLLAGAVLIGGYYVVPGHGRWLAARIVGYCLVSASAAVAVWVGTRRNRPPVRLPWVLLGASQLVYAAADAVFYVLHYGGRVATFPGPSDLLYLAHYPLVVAGLMGLIRRRTPGRDLPSVLDAAMLAVAASLLSWLVLIAPQAGFDAPWLTKAASLAFPIMDMAMLVVACRLILGAGQRPAAFYLLVANLLTIFTADTLYGLQQLRGTYQAGNFLDAIWLTGNLCLGAAALHPTMTRLTTPSPVPDQRLGLARLAALSAAALTAPGVLLIQNTWGTVRDASIIAVACAVLFLLVIARLAALVTDQRLLAITDSLTGLRTRRYIEAQLTTEISRADRAGGSLGVFIIDVDRFKAVNDRYGHPAGDRALIEIAARLRTAARAGDILARYGGEEFALLAPGMTTEAAHHLADRLHSVISATPVAVTPHTCLPITVSVGAATYPDHASDQTTLISTADRALYTAKTTGRDRVIMATAGPPNPAIPHPQPQPQNRPA